MFNTRYVLASRPRGLATEANFKKEEIPVVEPEEGEVLVRIHFISLDPAMRGWMNAGTTYVPGVDLGAVMRAFTAGEVILSRHPQWKVGQTVTGVFGVQTFAVVKGEHLTAVDTSLAPLSWYLGILGMPGLTAYFGLLDKGQPKPGETVLVSGAAGMVGSLVGQIAQIKGCKVAGIAGGEEKCSFLKNELNWDVVIDYKHAPDLSAALKGQLPNGIDIFFDNVGGIVLDAALTHLARGCRIVICGAISQYNQPVIQGPSNYMKIVTARGTLSGIIVLDYFDRASEALNDLIVWIKEGKIVYREHIVPGIEQFPFALNQLFTGGNNGKLLLQNTCE
jgi:NADPH-dependent curcumin reductase CurA